ncbi:hypothetical protein BO83DRAFT_401076 [Aspergillus eucalypticola CBS 122712]|uniref:Uncharacterized protein n=1 Tax=Aspergillus eucalypticola (strain CBS 122712 / IBT 29274) TaxID=1448314 RepID=A0A317UZZ9_ASPEC|nr:uncharacterized protein BO83DRAFT_401076 [Aspergillus eucalypticola CBS 122712]PWY67375.1 hypothetical protein BO83DRAFT_401076 [Aspergillus eucalypticola CBS 122712]
MRWSLVLAHRGRLSGKGVEEARDECGWMDALDGLKVKQAPVEMPSICPGNLPPAAILPPRPPRDSPFLSACPGDIVKRDIDMAYVTVCDNNHDDDAGFQPGSALRLGVRETRMSLPRLPRGNSTPWGCRSKLEHLIGACSLSSRELFDLRPAISGYYPPSAGRACRGWSPTALCCNRRLLLFPDNSSVEGMTTPAISLPDITSWRNEE